MAKWQKKFEQWKDAKSPISKTEVQALLERGCAMWTALLMSLSLPSLNCEVQQTARLVSAECQSVEASK